MTKSNNIRIRFKIGFTIFGFRYFSYKQNVVNKKITALKIRYICRIDKLLASQIREICTSPYWCMTWVAYDGRVRGCLGGKRGKTGRHLDSVVKKLISSGELMSIKSLQITSTMDCDESSLRKRRRGPMTRASIKEYIMNSGYGEPNPSCESSIYYNFYQETSKTWFQWVNGAVRMSFTSDQIKQITSEF